MIDSIPTLTIALPRPSQASAQNSRVHYHERARHTAYDRDLAKTAGKVLAATFGWVSGPCAAHIEYNIVSWRSRYLAQGLSRQVASQRAALAKLSRKYPAYAPEDVQNAIGAAKAYMDGLVDADLMPDDSYGWLRFMSGTVVLDSSHDPGVLITLTKVEVAL